MCRLGRSLKICGTINDNVVLERDRFGGERVMVWGRHYVGRKTYLVIINGNLEAHELRLGRSQVRLRKEEGCAWD